MRLVDEALQPFRQPVIAAGLAALAVHPLLHDHPFAVVGDEEPVQIEVETVLHGGAVDLGDQPAGAGQRVAVEADPIADRHELVRSLSRVRAAAAADVQPELARQRLEAPLQRADDARGDARGVPVHSHDRPEGLEPERICEAAQKLVAAVMPDDGLAHHRAEPRHPLAEPSRDAPAMQRKVGTACSLRQGFSTWFRQRFISGRAHRWVAIPICGT